AVLLADIDPDKYRGELTAIQKFIQNGQAADGSWDYPGVLIKGDTSVTHYALLGLWACSRAGVPTPPEVWSKSIKWHLETQNADGGFSYKPTTTQGYGSGLSVMNMTVNAIGSMSIAWMHLSDTPPNLDSEEPKKERQEKPKPVVKNNAVLEAVPIAPVPASGPLRETAGIPEGTARSMKRAYAWIVARFAPENPGPGFYGYYFYSLERMAALVNITSFGMHDWYSECSDVLIAKQNADGSWGTSASDTSFVILALVKSTAKLLKRIPPADRFGNGLLQGGRGLPDNLRDGDKPKPNAKPATPLDQLLTSLSKASNLDVEEVQEQLVEQVQIGDRRELIRQKELLVKLIQHPNAEIRRTAAWALGRTNDLSLARYLVTALEDPEVDVNIEAHNALCWISRKPAGFDLLLDPFEGLPVDAGPDLREATLKGWRTAALKAWGEWYLRNRPYRERGDEFEAKLREKLAALK
ncbi:MAG TPA: HEAT repeat domain-containing protein, partial [Caulifigura sp.]|nr:HEAT repeat domain-containing protein [Caulifigura sp.]